MWDLSSSESWSIWSLSRNVPFAKQLPALGVRWGYWLRKKDVFWPGGNLVLFPVESGGPGGGECKG